MSFKQKCSISQKICSIHGYEEKGIVSLFKDWQFDTIQIYFSNAFSPLPVFLTYFLTVGINRKPNDASTGAGSDGQSLSGHSHLMPIKKE